jgi:DnaK suppressor protein
VTRPPPGLAVLAPPCGERAGNTGTRLGVAVVAMEPYADSNDTRTRLAAERDETERRLAALTGSFADIVDASASSNADDEHDPEGCTIAFERSQVGALITQARTHLGELDAAVARVADGSYGICEGCGRAIASERLVARPVARTCITCASRR